MDKIVCVGKNYLEHAREMGDAVPERPVLFLKPPSVLTQATKVGETLEISLPRGKGEIHFETEIVLRIKNGLPTDVSLGLDLTLRTIQSELKKAGHPWTLGKVFPHSAVVGPWIPIQSFPRYLETPFHLAVNGKACQVGMGKDMRMSPTQLLAYAAEWFPLCDGDLFFTGTPAGVGALHPGDLAELQWGEGFSYCVRMT